MAITTQQLPALTAAAAQQNGVRGVGGWKELMTVELSEWRKGVNKNWKKVELRVSDEGRQMRCEQKIRASAGGSQFRCSPAPHQQQFSQSTARNSSTAAGGRSGRKTHGGWLIVTTCFPVARFAKAHCPL